MNVIKHADGSVSIGCLEDMKTVYTEEVKEVEETPKAEKPKKATKKK